MAHEQQKQGPMGRPSPQAFSSVRGLLAALFRLLILGLVVHLLLPQVTELRHSVDVVRSMNWLVLVVAALAQGMSYVGNGYTTQMALALFDVRLSLGRCMAIVTASYSLSVVWGGQVAYTASAFRWLRGAGTPSEAAMLGATLPALINILTVAAFSTIGLLYLFIGHRLSPALATVFALTLALLLTLSVMLFLGLKYRSWITGAVADAAKAWARLRRKPFSSEQTEAAIHRVFNAWDLMRHGAWRKPLTGDAMNVGMDLVSLYVLFLAAGYFASPGLVLAGYGLPLLAGKLSFLPGGLGVVEGGMVALYTALGVPGGVAVVVTISYRLLSFWLPLLLGLGLTLFLDRAPPSTTNIGPP